MLPHIPERQASVLHSAPSQFHKVPDTPLSPIGSPLRHSTRLNTNFGAQGVTGFVKSTGRQNSMFAGDGFRASSPARSATVSSGLFASMPTSPDRFGSTIDVSRAASPPRVPLESHGFQRQNQPTADTFTSPNRSAVYNTTGLSQSQQLPMTQRSPGTSIQARIDYACSLPGIYDRCEAIKVLCQELSVRDLASNLHYLLNIIFCIDKIAGSGDTIQCQTSLCVGCVTTRQQSRDASAVIDLLRPNGILFELLYGMYRKKLNVSQTAIQMFQRFKSSTAPTAMRPGQLIAAEMSAIELYFLAFSAYGLCMDKSYEMVMQNYQNLTQASRNTANNSAYGATFQKYTNYGAHQSAPMRYTQPPIINRQDVAYNQLLLHYTRFFMPLDLRLPNLIKSSSPSGFVQKQQQPAEPVHFSPIFKPNAFKVHQKNSLMESLNTQRTQNYVHGTVIENGQFIVTLADLLIGSLTRIWFSKELWPKATGFMLYEEHVRNLRLVVKHVISFVTIDTQKYQADMKTDAYAPEILGVVQNFQNNVLQRHIQPNMYPMLSAIFECWNMPPKIISPSYFRTIVELWLTYIQPWRYNEDAGGTGNFNFFGSDAQAKQRLPDQLEAAQIWLPYISANLDCYTTLFEDILKRAMRVDLSAQQECTILFRSVRVFSQTNLLDLIGMAGEQRVRSNSASNSNLVASNSPHLNGSLHGAPTSTGAPFSRIGPTVQALIRSCQDILARKFKFYKKEVAQKQQGWMQWLWQQLNDSSTPDKSQAKLAQEREGQMIASKLDQSIQLLSTIFGIDIPSPPVYEDITQSDSPQRCLKKLGNKLEHQLNESIDEFAEFELDDDMTEVNLTHAGREQLLSSGGHMHAPIVVNKHYDDLPCMSLELGMFLCVARLLGRLFTYKAQPYLQNVEENQPGFVNDFGRYWFQTAPNGMRYKNARISVRFLAHASFWFYFFISWSILRLFGYSTAQVVLIGFVLLACFMVVRYVMHKPIKSLLQKSKTE